MKNRRRLQFHNSTMGFGHKLINENGNKVYLWIALQQSTTKK